MELDKEKIEHALIRAGLSNKRSKEVAARLVGEDLSKDKKEKKDVRILTEVVKEGN